MTEDKVVYVVDRSSCQPSVLPEDMDTSGFVDVTTLTDLYKVYFDTKSGRTVRCEDYAKLVGL